MIRRDRFLDKIKEAFISYRIVCLIGPRQSGKTTISHQIKKEFANVHYFDLQNPKVFKQLDNPEGLALLIGLIVIDEIQRKPELFSYLRYLHDEYLDQKFLILGSAPKLLIQQSSKSLFGRVICIEVTPFSIDEIWDIDKLWFQGGFPKNYLVNSAKGQEHAKNYMDTYIEKDLLDLKLNYDAKTIKKLWNLLAHYHGQVANYSSLSTSLAIKELIVKRYVIYLESSFMLRILNPLVGNFKKGQVQNQKIYYRDSGLLHCALKIQDYEMLSQHPKEGASFEGFAIEEIIRAHNANPEDCYFWALQNEAELDLIICQYGKKFGFEIKLSDAPKLTKSMLTALEELKLDSLTVISLKESGYMLNERIQVISLKEYIRQKTSTSVLKILDS